MVGTRAMSVFALAVARAFAPPPDTKGSTATSSSEPLTSELYTGWNPSPAQRHRRTYAERVSANAPKVSIRGAGNVTKKSAMTRPVSLGGNGGCVSGGAARIANPTGPRPAVGLNRRFRSPDGNEKDAVSEVSARRSSRTLGRPFPNASFANARGVLGRATPSSSREASAADELVTRAGFRVNA